jgi:trans-2-enoyl-CoA reductase
VGNNVLVKSLDILRMNPVAPPIIKTTVKTYESFTVELAIMQLNISATFSVKLYDASGTYIDMIMMTMSGEDYNKWTSDAYVYEWVNDQLHKTSP